MLVRGDPGIDLFDRLIDQPDGLRTMSVIIMGGLLQAGFRRLQLRFRPCHLRMRLFFIVMMRRRCGRGVWRLSLRIDAIGGAAADYGDQSDQSKQSISHAFPDSLFARCGIYTLWTAAL